MTTRTRRGVVMVGDPQQLPATIFSQVGKQLALERSLFERLAEVSEMWCLKNGRCDMRTKVWWLRKLLLAVGVQSSSMCFVE